MYIKKFPFQLQVIRITIVYESHIDQNAGGAGLELYN